MDGIWRGWAWNGLSCHRIGAAAGDGLAAVVMPAARVSTGKRNRGTVERERCVGDEPSEAFFDLAVASPCNYAELLASPIL
jgi:hypothetical protein